MSPHRDRDQNIGAAWIRGNLTQIRIWVNFGQERLVVHSLPTYSTFSCSSASLTWWLTRVYWHFQYYPSWENFWSDEHISLKNVNDFNNDTSWMDVIPWAKSGLGWIYLGGVRYIEHLRFSSQELLTLLPILLGSKVCLHFADENPWEKFLLII